MDAPLDVVKLRSELSDLARQRAEVDGRLRRVAGPGLPEPSRGRPHPHRPPQGVHPLPGNDPQAPALQNRRMSSMVARLDDVEHHDRKRPAEGSLLEENVDVKRRNKRLFGAILGTLQRFSRDEEQARSTTTAQRRADLERKAEEKKAEEIRRLRQQARDEMRQIREGDVARKWEISAQAACKRLEILYATRLARADKLCTRLLLTLTEPRLYYCPAKPSTEVECLAEEQRQEHGAWKAAQLEQLEQEKAQLMEQLMRRRWGGGEQEEQRDSQAAAGAVADTEEGSADEGADTDGEELEVKEAEDQEQPLQQDEDVEQASGAEAT